MSARRPVTSQGPATPPSASNRFSTLPPPSSFRSASASSPTGAAAAAAGPDSLSAQSRRVRNRVSRNFEDALKDDETVLLSAGGLDESRLGVVTPTLASRSATSSPAADGAFAASSSSSMPRSRAQMHPATPTVVPPTPLAGNSPADPARQADNGFDSSSVDPAIANVNVPPLPDNASKRRSLLRSPGTASSPDLATLVRKAKERGGVIGSAAAANSKANTQEHIPGESPSSPQFPPNPRDYLSPTASNPRNRATSSTSSFSIITPQDAAGIASTVRTPSNKLQKTSGGYTPISSESSPSSYKPVGGGSPAQRDTQKASIRSKANTFLKSFMSTGSVRDKRRALSLTASLQPDPTNEPPPVPPLPPGISAAARYPDDVFASSSSSEGAAPPRPPPSSSKPPPSSMNNATLRPRTRTSSRASSKSSNSSVLTPQNTEGRTTPGEPSSSLFPANYVPVARPPTTNASSAATVANRRRSASVGSVDISKLSVPLADGSRKLPQSADGTSPLREWDMAMKGVLDNDDFAGAFKGFTNPISPRKDRFPALGIDTQRFGSANRSTSAKSSLQSNAQLQPPSRPSVSSSQEASTAWSSSQPRTSESSVASSATSSTAKGIMVLDSNGAFGNNDTLRLVSSPTTMRRPSNPETPDGHIPGRHSAPSPTLSTPSEDVFYDAESTRSSFSQTGTGGESLSPSDSGRDDPTTPVIGRLTIPEPSRSGSGPNSPDTRPSLSPTSSYDAMGSQPPSAYSDDSPRTPIFARNATGGGRVPARSPNPFNPGAGGYSAQNLANTSTNGGASGMSRAAAASTPALLSTVGSGAQSSSSRDQRQEPANRSVSAGKITNPFRAGSTSSNRSLNPNAPSPTATSPSVANAAAFSSAAASVTTSSRGGSLDIPVRKTTGRENLSKTASYIQPRSPAISSEPSLTPNTVSSFTSSPGQTASPLFERTITPSTHSRGSGSSALAVGEDGMLQSSDGGAAGRTVRLVGTGASGASVGALSTNSEGSTGTGQGSFSAPPSNSNTLTSSSIYAHSYEAASSTISMSNPSTTDLMLSRYPSSTKMAQAAAAGAAGNGSSSTGPEAMQEAEEELEARAKTCAEKCWAEDESFVSIEKMAEWLGGRDDVKRRAVKHYMDNFDFTGLRLDVAFRHLCGKLFLRAETQQVDRILQQFSARFWECNPAPLYHSADVVHALTYSIMLLNTDLHIADISNRMSRPQFVKNTLGTVLPSLNRTETESPYSMPAATLSAASLDDEEEGTLEGTTPNESSPPPTTRTQNYRRHPKNRSGSMTSWRGIMQHAGASSSALQLGSAGSDSPTTSRVSLNLPQGEANGSNGYLESPERRGSRDQLSATRKIWEQEMENFLKEVYDAIKKQQVVQPVSARASTSLGPASSLGRKGSMRNGPNDRMANLKRGSVRGLTSLLSQQNNIATQPPPSGDGRVSPSPSFATSIGENLVTPSSTFYAPTLGFASNLSHSIIKEAQEDDAHSHHSADTVSTSVSISDEELALLGAPWAKEGMLCRKQFWETSKRRAKARNWMDVFVVISKGEFSMFTFGENGPSSAVTSVGGGNWLSNANLVGEFSLAHSLAHALPAPGYNRQRPYCFVLTLASGAVYFFQAGTEELVSEWVSTCNYWAARQSREPLSGGVSNMEYGWSRVENPAEADAPDNASLYRRDHSDSMSIRSGRSGRLGRQASTLFGSMPAERMFIHEWKPPMHPSIASTNDEETQLDSLQKQVGNLKLELEKHNALRRPMQDLFAAKSNNSTKAMNNWEQKSQYLLSELVKYQSYVDSLREGMNLRLKRRGDRALERALREPKDEDEDVALKPTPSSSTAKSTAPPSSLSTPPQTLGRRASGVRPSLSVQETIQEAEEPITPNPFGTLHRRAGADSGR